MEAADDESGEGVEGVEDAGSGGGGGFGDGEVRGGAAERLIHGGAREGVGEVAFVVLEDDGEGVGMGAVGGEVLVERVPRGEIVRGAARVAVGDEDEAIGSAEDDLAGGVVVCLAGDGVELEAGAVAVDEDAFDGEEVEEEGAVAHGGERDEVAACGAVEPLVDPGEVGGFSGHGGAGVDEFEGDLAGFVVEDGHGARGSGGTGEGADGHGEFFPEAVGEMRGGVFDGEAPVVFDEEAAGEVGALDGEGAGAVEVHGIGEGAEGGGGGGSGLAESGEGGRGCGCFCGDFVAVEEEAREDAGQGGAVGGCHGRGDGAAAHEEGLQGELGAVVGDRLALQGDGLGGWSGWDDWGGRDGGVAIRGLRRRQAQFGGASGRAEFCEAGHVGCFAGRCGDFGGRGCGEEVAVVCGGDGALEEAGAGVVDGGEAERKVARGGERQEDEGVVWWACGADEFRGEEPAEILGGHGPGDGGGGVLMGRGCGGGRCLRGVIRDPGGVRTTEEMTQIEGHGGYAATARGTAASSQETDGLSR